MVVPAETSAVLTVDHDDRRLTHRGLAGAVIELTLDPNSMRPKVLAAGQTDERGRFDIPVDVPGAGMLEYDLGIMCRLNGYSTVWQIAPMPPRRRQLLVLMKPGRRHAGPPARWHRKMRDADLHRLIDQQ